jgi:hypothetical protein
VDDPGYEPPADAPEQREPPPKISERWHERWRWRLLILLALVFVFAGWRAGTFDRVLVNVGLNAHACERNALGATFCGQELTEYNEHVAQIKQQSETAGRNLEEDGRKAQRKSETLDKEAQRHAEEAE